MNRWQRWLLAVPTVFLCVAATQYAMRGRHQPSGNAGYLGTKDAGVEGIAGPSEVGGLAGGNGVMGSTGVPYGNGVLGTCSGYYCAGVRGTSYETNSPGVSGSGPTTGVIGQGLASDATGVWGYALNGTGVRGEGGVNGIRGASTGTNAATSAGVFGSGATGVHGDSAAGFGIKGTTVSGTGVYGVLAPGGEGHAGYFEGRVHVVGTLSKSAGSFKIDHPLDPAGKYLYHSFVESPDMKNIYDGVATLDGDGTAVVVMPDWFDALNKDFRYQLTCIGEHAPVYVAEKIHENRFRIAGGYAGMEVSWQVTGTRNDLYAQAHRIPVEQVKPPREVGRFLHPELYRQQVQ